MLSEPQVLRPFDRREMRTVKEAAVIAKRPVRTIREWCARHDLGRRIGAQWAVSIVALDLFLSGELEALKAYLRGDRESPSIVACFARWQIPLPKKLANHVAANAASATYR
jgi:hypothetical protein